MSLTGPIQGLLIFLAAFLIGFFAVGAFLWLKALLF
jgi:hypothetical protein